MREKEKKIRVLESDARKPLIEWRLWDDCRAGRGALTHAAIWRRSRSGAGRPRGFVYFSKNFLARRRVAVEVVERACDARGEIPAEASCKQGESDWMFVHVDRPAE
jgi:hypothetical protein